MDTVEYLGAYDNQTVHQKDKNWQQSEIVTAIAPVVWPEKDPKNFVRYPVRDQDGSGTCVTQTYAKELSIIFQQKYGIWIDFSAAFPYQQRNNPSISGCSTVDIYDIFPKIGNVFESFMPSQFMSDEQVMAVKNEPYFKDLAKVWCIKRIEMAIDFDTVASTIQQTGKGAMLWFKFNREEWLDIPVYNGKPFTSGHSICGVDVAKYLGQEVIVCDESWGLGHSMNGQRLITRAYFNARCFQASYLKVFKFEEASLISRPKFDGSIESLQDCLKWEGLFDVNQESTGIFGNITRSSLIKFQKRYSIFPTLGNFGPLTKQKLIELYS